MFLLGRSIKICCTAVLSFHAFARCFSKYPSRMYMYAPRRCLSALSQGWKRLRPSGAVTCRSAASASGHAWEAPLQRWKGLPCSRASPTQIASVREIQQHRHRSSREPCCRTRMEQTAWRLAVVSRPSRLLSAFAGGGVQAEKTQSSRCRSRCWKTRRCSRRSLSTSSTSEGWTQGGNDELENVELCVFGQKQGLYQLTHQVVLRLVVMRYKGSSGYGGNRRPEMCELPWPKHDIEHMKYAR